MKENNYTVRYARVDENRNGKHTTLISVWDAKGYTKKYTLDKAREKAKDILNTRTDVEYCKIYNGRTMIEMIER